MNLHIVTGFIFSLLAVFNLSAQNRCVVKGQILDASTQEGVPFANIVVYGTTIGIASDEAGFYRLENISPGFIRLEVSRLGYKTKVTGEFWVNTVLECTENVCLEVESAALRGLEKSLEPSIITILGTVVFRMIWMATVFKWIPTYEMLMNVYISSWVFTGGLIFIVYVLHMRKLEKEFAEKAA